MILNILFLLSLSLVLSRSEMIQRSWHVPEMTPIIEVFDSGEGDPFTPKPLVSIATYGEM